MTDPIADLLTRIRNAIKAHHQSLTVPYSKMKEGILKIIKDSGFIESYSVEKIDNHPVLEVVLKETINDLTLKRVSKPGQRIYVKNDELKAVKSGLGIAIVSTPKGLMNSMDAKKQKLGGELICEIY